MPGYTVAPAATKQLDDTYFDTESWRVHQAGFTARVRRKGDGAELTLKAMADAVGAMRSRREMNEPIEGELASEPGAAPGECGGMLRLMAGKHPLRPIFSLHTERRTFMLADGVGEIGEIAVDETTIPVGEDVPARLARVEVEVHPDAVERADRFVNVLIAACTLVPAGTSKFEAALVATGQHVPTVRADLGSTAVEETLTAGETAYAVMRKHFGVFLANEAGTRLGEDIEALHDMRVATRRLRAAMAAFAPYISPRMQAYRDQLGWIAALLGTVRDLDVQLERMAEWREGFSEAQGRSLQSVEALLKARRELGRKRMLAGLDSRRYESFIARFAAALHRGPSRTFTPGRLPVLAVAPGLVEDRYRKLRKIGDGIGPKTPAQTYHALRIRAKKLRYAIEFVGPLYGKPASAFAGQLAELQDLLGLHQDADVAEGMLHQMAEQNSRRLGASTLLVMGAISERYRRHAEQLRKEFPERYRPVTGQEWRRLERAMEARRPRGG